jgi:hypothetical protein
MIYEKKLLCNVHKLLYDYRLRKGKLFMPANNSCDKTACIEMFKAIDPEVREIETFAGTEVDTLYMRDGEMWITRACWRGRRAK